MMNPTVKNSFAPKAETPILHEPRSHRHKFSAIGAIVLSPKLRQPDLLFQLLPTDQNFDSGLVTEFVRQILKRNPWGRTFIIWDRAPIHRGKEMRKFLSRCRRAYCHHFPPYSPELNPVELVWSQTKWHDLANCVPHDMDELRTRAEHSLLNSGNRKRMLTEFIKHSTDPRQKNDNRL